MSRTDHQPPTPDQTDLSLPTTYAGVVPLFDLGPQVLPTEQPYRQAKVVSTLTAPARIWQIQDLLEPAECRHLLTEVMKQTWTPADQHGTAHDHDDQLAIGSWRASCFSQEFANRLWSRLSAAIRLPELTMPPAHRGPNQQTPLTWAPVGISPLLRFIRYTYQPTSPGSLPSGTLLPHYDAPFAYSKTKSTQLSLVLCLDTHDTSGGATRFIAESPQVLSKSPRAYADWSRPPEPSEVLWSTVIPIGSALIFPHRTLHDSSPVKSPPHKLILRTDVIYQLDADNG
jgi:hypothetical protein